MSNYGQIIREVRHGGDIIPSRLGDTFELTGVPFRFTPGYAPERKGINYGIGYAEILQLIGGIYRPETFATVAPKANLALFTADMAYGPRIMDQVPDVITELKTNPETRRAVLFVGRHSNGPTASLPCTISIQFLVRSNALQTIVTMRSWDLIKGLPYDVMMFGALAQVIAKLAGYRQGSVTVTAGSAHIYASDTPKAAHIGSVDRYFKMPGLMSCHSWYNTVMTARCLDRELEKGVTPSWLTWEQ